MATMLDLNEPSSRRASRKANPFSTDISQALHVDEAICRVQRACELVLSDCAQLVEHSLLDYDQMNFVIRCERFYQDNKHLGVHWLHQLRRLSFNKQSQLKESIIQARFIG